MPLSRELKLRRRLAGAGVPLLEVDDAFDALQPEDEEITFCRGFVEDPGLSVAAFLIPPSRRKPDVPIVVMGEFESSSGSPESL